MRSARRHGPRRVPRERVAAADDLVTVPENVEERRAFLQARVGLFGKVLAWFSTVVPRDHRDVLGCLAKKPADRPSGADVLERRFSALAAGWTQDDARTWWREHRDTLARLRRSRPRPTPSPIPKILETADALARTAVL
jgi:hypothetical protein